MNPTESVAGFEAASSLRACTRALTGPIFLVTAIGGALALAGCDGGSEGKGPKGPTPVSAAPAAGPASGAGAPNAGTGASSGGAGATGVATGVAPKASGASQAGGFPVSGPDGDQTRIEVGGLVMPKPVNWVWTAPTMQFRALQYAVPAQGANAPAAELVFSVFPAGDGGPIDPNLDRWANQFRAADNTAAPSQRTVVAMGGMQVHRIESKGAYMGMGAAAPRPSYMQLGAIVEAPGRNIFIKLVGPEATVESNRAAFDAMLAGMAAGAAPAGAGATGAAPTPPPAGK
ncbi:MAG: hypothetical protein U0625_03685 [Phycisphaerales bacterium]